MNPDFGTAPEDISPPEPRSSTHLWPWITGLILVALLAWPIARKVMNRPASSAGTSAVAQTDLNRSFQLYHDHRYQESIEAAKAALKLDPNSADAYNNMAVAYLALRNWDEAIRSCVAALRIRPDYQLARNNLAWILQEKNKGPGAQPAAATEATWLNASLENCRANRFEDCIANAREALKLNPESHIAYNNIAVGYIGLRKFDEAIHNARESIRIRPDFQLAKNNLAWALDLKAKSGR